MTKQTEREAYAQADEGTKKMFEKLSKSKAPKWACDLCKHEQDTNNGFGIIGDTLLCDGCYTENQHSLEKAVIEAQAKRQDIREYNEAKKRY